jgi:hypothetical protein
MPMLMRLCTTYFFNLMYHAKVEHIYYRTFSHFNDTSSRWCGSHCFMHFSRLHLVRTVIGSWIKINIWSGITEILGCSLHVWHTSSISVGLHLVQTCIGSWIKINIWSSIMEISFLGWSLHVWHTSMLHLLDRLVLTSLGTFRRGQLE